jgi:hypothetical protein
MLAFNSLGIVVSTAASSQQHQHHKQHQQRYDQHAARMPSLPLIPLQRAAPAPTFVIVAAFQHNFAPRQPQAFDLAPPLHPRLPL